MSEQPAEKNARCAHRFARAGWWPWRSFDYIAPHRKWACVSCGFTTRTYDGIDRAMTRPIHRHMSVAVPGFNTYVTPPASTEGGAR